MKTPAGVTYAVDRVASQDPLTLPQTSELKMADGDIAKFAVDECALDVSVQYAPQRCDVYVQSDKAGTLIGYVFVLRDGDGTRFKATTTLNAEKQPGGGACHFSGTIYDGATNYNLPVADPSRDFDGRQVYSVSNSDTGSALVSEIAPDAAATDADGAAGVWYFTKRGDKLRIAQERWNYCYKNPEVSVDDVFYRAVSFEKMAG